MAVSLFLKLKPVTKYKTTENAEEPEEIRSRVRHTALNLLARREHTILELQHKLNRRGFSADIVDTVLDELVAENLLNETRYAEVYSHSRADKGYGPLRIQRELRERGVDDEIIAELLSHLDDIWMKKLTQIQRKRFGEPLPKSLVEQARQTRFLRHRGFTLDQIKQLFREA